MQQNFGNYSQQKLTLSNKTLTWKEFVAVGKATKLKV